MSEHEDHKHTGHFFARLDAANIAARYFNALIKIYGSSHRAKRRIFDTFGLVTSEQLQNVREELDRTQGLVRELQRRLDDKQHDGDK